MIAKARANAEWERWAEVDPLFGVASWAGRGAGGPNAWTDKEFYSLGASDWADFLRHWQRYGVEPGTCVEIGCGAARLTRAMAQFFSHVHGVDVAGGMLKKAVSAVDGMPVSLHLGDGLTIPLPDRSVDSAFSTHVFQHLDRVEDAVANWREVERVLRPGGSLMVHLPVHMWPGGMQRLQRAYAVRRMLGDARARYQRWRLARDRGAPIMRGQSYEWAELDSTLSSLGFVDVELSVFRVRSNDGVHPFVLARKSADA